MLIVTGLFTAKLITLLIDYAYLNLKLDIVLSKEFNEGMLFA